MDSWHVNSDNIVPVLITLTVAYLGWCVYTMRQYNFGNCLLFMSLGVLSLLSLTNETRVVAQPIPHIEYEPAIAATAVRTYYSNHGTNQYHQWGCDYLNTNKPLRRHATEPDALSKNLFPCEHCLHTH